MNDASEIDSLIQAARLDAEENKVAVFEDGLLVLGSEFHAASASVALEHGITDVLNCAGSSSDYFLGDVVAVSSECMNQDAPTRCPR